MTETGVNKSGSAGAFGRRLLLAVDAKGYGGADAVTQSQFQEAIRRLLNEAADAARLNPRRWVTQEGGDSLFAVLPEGASEPDLVDTFMRTLNARLRDFNCNRMPRAWLRLRAAVHFGPASAGANGFVGSAPVEIGRVLNCAALRGALAEVPDACLAVAVSAIVFRDVVKAHTTLREDEFRREQVAEKEYRGEAWIWVPGAGVRPSEPDSNETAPRDTVPDGQSVAEGAGHAAGEASRQPQTASVYHQWNQHGGAGAQGPGANVTINNHWPPGSYPPDELPARNPGTDGGGA